MRRSAVAVGMLMLAGPAWAQKIDWIEFQYELATLSCGWAKRCAEKDVKRECDTRMTQAKKNWDDAKASGKGAPSDLKRDDWERCAKAFDSADCTKYQKGLPQFLGAVNGVPECMDYVDFKRKAGKYAKKR